MQPRISPGNEAATAVFFAPNLWFKRLRCMEEMLKRIIKVDEIVRGLDEQAEADRRAQILALASQKQEIINKNIAFAESKAKSFEAAANEKGASYYRELEAETENRLKLMNGIYEKKQRLWADEYFAKCVE
jgi:hypothetical protein